MFRPYTRFGFALSLLGMLTACTSLEEDHCAAKCDCEGCSDAAYDLCVSEHDADFREADYRGCVDYYDDWLVCEDETNVCKGADWETSCKTEHDRYKNCVKT